MAEDEAIVAVEVPARRRRVFGMSVGRPGVPGIKPGMHLYMSSQEPDGSRDLRRIMEGGLQDAERSHGGAQFYHVRLESFRFGPVFSKVAADEQGHDWDCRIGGQLSVSDSRRFLTSFAAGIATPNSPVTPGMAESWIANRIAPRVRDAVREYSVADLKDREALPPSWWEKQLADWLDEFGVSVCVDDVSWSSAQDEAAEAEAARQRDLERVAQARQRERGAELREAAAKAEYEKRKKQIESDLSLSDEERAHQLQLLEKHRRKELIEADTEIENARREAERAALKHEVTLARLRQDADAAGKAKEKDQQGEEQHQAVLNELGELKAALAKLADFPGNLLAQLAGRDAATANAAAERVVSPEIDISASVLTGLGFRVERQKLVQCLRKKAIADGEPVTICKTELVTRNIGTAKVKGLPINTSLQFEFSTERAGFVTVVNIGTSGSVYLHAPNAYVGPSEAKVGAGKRYMIPGSDVLPWERLRQCGLDYVEVGPPGWEHLAVLVSHEPLIAASVAARSRHESPFVRLTSQEVDELGGLLTSMPPDNWSAAVLSFLVG